MYTANDTRFCYQHKKAQSIKWEIKKKRRKFHINEIASTYIQLTQFATKICCTDIECNLIDRASFLIKYSKVNVNNFFYLRTRTGPQ